MSLASTAFPSLVRAGVMAILSSVSHAGSAAALLPADLEREGQAGITGLRAPAGLTLSPDGKQVYVAGADGNLSVFRRDANTGALTFLETHTDGVSGVNGLRTAMRVAVSGDGAHVYVTGLEQGSIAVFAREAATGQLLFSGALRRDVNGVACLGQALHIAVSADGKHVYVTSRNAPATPAVADCLVVFERNPNSGLLTVIESYVDGVNGIDGLTAPGGLSIAPDDKHVYVTAEGDDSLAAFERDPMTGKLRLIQLLRNGIGGILGLGDARGLDLSAEGRHLYVTSVAAGRVTLFLRDPVTGQLKLGTSYQDGAAGIDGLAGALDVALDPEGARLYVAGAIDDAIAVFQRNTASGELSFTEAVRDMTATSRLDNVGGLAAGGLAAGGPLSQLYTISASTQQLAAWTVPVTDLALTHTVLPSAPRMGDVVAYDFTVANVSGTEATHVTVMTSIPSGSEFVEAATATAAFQPNADALTFTLGSLQAGASVNATLKVRALQEGTLILRAELRAAQVDRLADNNTVTSTTLVGPPFVNTPPIAHDDTAQTAPDTAVAIPVLHNDTDSDSSVGQVVALDPAKLPATSAAGATLTANLDDGTVLYQPAAGFLGEDSFEYGITDGAGGVSTARVFVKVNSIPVAVSDMANTLPATSVIIDVVSNDSDPDGGALSITSIEIPEEGGAASVRDGVMIEFIPSTSARGPVVFSYTVADTMGATAQAQVTVLVNTPPVAGPDSVNVRPEEKTHVALLANDQDADGDTLALVQVDAAALAGIATLATNDDGSITLTVDSAIGFAEVPYTVRDTHGAEATGLLHVRVNTPPLAMEDQVATQVDTPVDVLVLFNDQQRDRDDALTVVAEQTDTRSKANGRIEIIMTESGQAALRYVPDHGFIGSDHFEYTVQDQFGETSHGVVTIAVRAAPGVEPRDETADGDTEPAVGESPSAPASEAQDEGGGSIDVIMLSLALVFVSLVRREWRR